MAELAHYKEMHPTLFRVNHWVNLIAMGLLILSGIEIHYPVIPYAMSIARGIHVFCGLVLIINCLVRIIGSFFVKSSPLGGTREKTLDVYNWLPQKYNRHQGIQWIKYYLFIKKDHPLTAKLGVPQKITYILTGIAVLFMGYTGLCLWDVTMNVPIFSAFTMLVGGTMKLRVIHYCMMYYFICFTMIHGYLALIDGKALPRLMFLGKETAGMTQSLETWNFDGYDDLSEASAK